MGVLTRPKKSPKRRASSPFGGGSVSVSVSEGRFLIILTASQPPLPHGERETVSPLTGRLLEEDAIEVPHKRNGVRCHGNLSELDARVQSLRTPTRDAQRYNVDRALLPEASDHRAANGPFDRVCGGALCVPWHLRSRCPKKDVKGCFCTCARTCICAPVDGSDRVPCVHSC